MTALLLSIASALCFGIGMITARCGLRHQDARSGAAVSIPSATVLFIVATPFVIDWSAYSVIAMLVFAAVGLFYPALVTLLTFRSNEELGPTITSAISGTAPLFAMLAAALLLDEHMPPQIVLCALGVTAGVALLSWRPGAMRSSFAGRALFWPVSGAIVRGLAQAGAKAGLLLWGNPFAASLIGYLVSSTAVIGADRLRHGPRRKLSRPGLQWFVITGLVNGGAMVLMYSALTLAPVSTVAPVIAAYPLVTVIVSTLCLRNETINARVIAGAVITVSAIAWLAAHRVT